MHLLYLLLLVREARCVHGRRTWQGSAWGGEVVSHRVTEVAPGKERERGGMLLWPGWTYRRESTLVGRAAQHCPGGNTCTRSGVWGN